MLRVDAIALPTEVVEPYGRFRRALQQGNLHLVRAATAELPVIRLDDAPRAAFQPVGQPGTAASSKHQGNDNPSGVATCFCGCGRRVRLLKRNADRYGRQAVWLVDVVGDATQAISLDSLAEPEHMQFHAMDHGWQEFWAAVVHGEKRWRDLTSVRGRRGARTPLLCSNGTGQLLHSACFSFGPVLVHHLATTTYKQLHRPSLQLGPDKQKSPRLRGFHRFQPKPTPGLEPGTPSLRVKCSTS
jgi:hypothetical protein